MTHIYAEFYQVGVFSKGLYFAHYHFPFRILEVSAGLVPAGLCVCMNGFVRVLRAGRKTYDFHSSFLAPESFIFSCRTEEVPTVEEA